MTDEIEVLLGEQLPQANQTRSWLWDGLVAPGQMTLFTSVCKLGKTTLLAHFLAARKAGGEFLGRPVLPGASVIVSEETAELWSERGRTVGFRAEDSFICRPFASPPSMASWERLLDKVLALRLGRDAALVIIDTLSSFLPPGAENVPAILVQSLAPVRRLTSTGMAVLLVHHPRKVASPARLASRGSTMLPGFADIILEMHEKEGADRQRRLLCYSRFAATPPTLLFELSADGRAFQVIDEPPPADEFFEIWHILRMVLEDAERELTRQEILEQWPSTFPKPRDMKLWRQLDAAFARGLVRIEGAGRRADPFRYYLPEKLAEWQDDPLYQLKRQINESMKMTQATLKSAGVR